MFRDLKANEIDVRVSTYDDSYIQVLLYKDARVDMNILDETIGSHNWQREHKELKGNIYCGVSIYDNESKQWSTKWDCGKESFTESEKGEASDSFKRACVNWGIGRELYTAPKIYIRQKDKEGNENYKISLNKKTNKNTTYTSFYVEAIQIENKEITAISIKNDQNKRVFVWKKG